MTKAYRIKVTVRNNLLLSAIEEAGYKSQTDFAKAAFIGLRELNALVGLRSPPITKLGEFSDVAKAVMEALGAAPTDLWTEEQLTIALRRNSVEREVENDVFKRRLEEFNGQTTLPSPEDEYMAKESAEEVRAALSQLKPRRKTVVAMRFGIDSPADYTLREVGDQLNVTTERARHIEAKALSDLRRTYRLKQNPLPRAWKTQPGNSP